MIDTERERHASKVLDLFLADFYSRRTQKSTTRSIAAPVHAAIDPIAVGEAAKKYQRAERAKGHEISATDAVAHVLRQAGHTSRKGTTRDD